MRSKLTVAAAGLVLAVALGVPAGAQAAVTPSGSAHTTSTLAAPAALSLQGCGEIWNSYYMQYAYVDYTGNNPLEFKSYGGSGESPYFCNISVTTVNGAFEIGDYSQENSSGEMPCLAVDTDSTTEQVVDDTLSACNQQDYLWDQWYAINTGMTYHSNILWEFKNKDNNDCLEETNYGAGIYAAACGYQDEYFAWPDSNL
jgi:uncharacterized membrane protein